MNKVSRRDFLKSLGAVSALLVAGRSGLTIFGAEQEKPFEFLVIGDSLIWGQGLEEKDKFYTLIHEWLKTTAFGRPRAVNMKVKAHSGATLKLHAEETEKFKKAGHDETHYYPPEVNVSSPSSWKQIEVAADEYRAAGINGADLIMISGGITDITTSGVYNPKGNDDELRTWIKKYCQDDMFDVLDLAATKNPDAKLVVIGYFPAISPKSDKKKIFNAWLEVLSFPRAFKWTVNNSLVRPFYFDKPNKRGIERSRIWIEESTRHLKLAVDRINQKYGAGRAVFVESPLTEEHSAEAAKHHAFQNGQRRRRQRPDGPVPHQRLPQGAPGTKGRDGNRLSRQALRSSLDRPSRPIRFTRVCRCDKEGPRSNSHPALKGNTKKHERALDPRNKSFRALSCLFDLPVTLLSCRHYPW